MWRIIPQSCEGDDHNDGEDSDCPMLGFLKDLDQAVQEGCEPEEPLEEGCQHHSTHNRDVNDLVGPLAEAPVLCLVPA